MKKKTYLFFIGGKGIKFIQVTEGFFLFFSDEWFFWQIFADVQETENETHLEIYGTNPGANFPPVSL